MRYFGIAASVCDVGRGELGAWPRRRRSCRELCFCIFFHGGSRRAPALCNLRWQRGSNSTGPTRCRRPTTASLPSRSRASRCLLRRTTARRFPDGSGGGRGGSRAAAIRRRPGHCRRRWRRRPSGRRVSRLLDSRRRDRRHHGHAVVGVVALAARLLVRRRRNSGIPAIIRRPPPATAACARAKSSRRRAPRDGQHDDQAQPAAAGPGDRPGWSSCWRSVGKI